MPKGGSLQVGQRFCDSPGDHAAAYAGGKHHRYPVKLAVLGRFAFRAQQHMAIGTKS